MFDVKQIKQHKTCCIEKLASCLVNHIGVLANVFNNVTDRDDCMLIA